MPKRVQGAPEDWGLDVIRTCKLCSHTPLFSILSKNKMQRGLRTVPWGCPAWSRSGGSVMHDVAGNERDVRSQADWALQLVAQSPFPRLPAFVYPFCKGVSCSLCLRIGPVSWGRWHLPWELASLPRPPSKECLTLWGGTSCSESQAPGATLWLLLGGWRELIHVRHAINASCCYPGHYSCCYDWVHIQSVMYHLLLI